MTHGRHRESAWSNLVSLSLPRRSFLTQVRRFLAHFLLPSSPLQTLDAHAREAVRLALGARASCLSRQPRAEEQERER